MTEETGNNSNLATSLLSTSHMTERLVENSNNNSTDDCENGVQFTLDEALEAVGAGWYQFVLLQIAGSGWMFDGLQLSIIPFILPTLTKQWTLSPLQSGVVGAILFVGMVFGACVGGFLSDRFGRKIVFISGMLICSLSSVLCAFSIDFWSFILLRLIVGTGLGATVPTDFSLFMEFCPKKYRGTFSSLMNIYWGSGFVIVVCLCWIFIPPFPDNGWRIVVGLTSLPGLITLPFRFFIDESPRYLLVTNQHEKALTVVRKVCKWNGSQLRIDKLTMPQHHNYSTSTISAFFDQFRLIFSSELAVSTLLLWMIWFLLSFGSWGFSFLLPIVFAKMPNFNLYSNALIVAIIGAMGYATTSLLMDRVPRTKLLGVSMFMLGIVTAVTAISQEATFILIVALCANFIAAAPWSTLYTYTPEVYPTTVRATGTGIASAFLRVGGAFSPIVTELLFDKNVSAPFVVDGIALIMGSICCFLLPIETLGKELKDDVVDPPSVTTDFSDTHPASEQSPHEYMRVSNTQEEIVA